MGVSVAAESGQSRCRFRSAGEDPKFSEHSYGFRPGRSAHQAVAIGCAGVAHFTPHDLRRTVRTIMSKCGYGDDVQRAAIGQASPALDAVYNLDERWAIRKMAFEACHDYMRACIEGRDTAAVVKRQRANNPQNAMKLKLLARLVALHAEAAE
jgi:hypothetical protein